MRAHCMATIGAPGGVDNFLRHNCIGHNYIGHNYNQVAWIIFFAISSVISVVSLAMKARIFIAQLRETRHIALDLSDEQTVHEKKMEEHREKLVEITHEIHLLCARGSGFPRSMTAMRIWHTFKRLSCP